MLKQELAAAGVRQLRDIARDVGITMPQKLRKEELIDQIVLCTAAAGKDGPSADHSDEKTRSEIQKRTGSHRRAAGGTGADGRDKER